MKQTYRIKAWMPAGLMALSFGCPAQDSPFRAIVTAKLDTVSTAGIYRIVLPPSFVARCSLDCSNVRIIDRNDKEVPYVPKTDPHDKLNAGYLPIPDPKIGEYDSNRHSGYLLYYKDDYRIDRISLVITGPALYKRTAILSSVPEWRKWPIATLSISPGDSVFTFPPVKAGRLEIDVANEDNEPLKISRVATFQSGIYLLAYLQPRQEYRLAADPLDAYVRAPEYDLRYFTDSMRLLGTVALGPIQIWGDARAPAAVKSVATGNGRRSSFILWGIVAVILGLLLFVSVKLTRAVDKKQE